MAAVNLSLGKCKKKKKKRKKVKKKRKEKKFNHKSFINRCVNKYN